MFTTFVARLYLGNDLLALIFFKPGEDLNPSQCKQANYVRQTESPGFCSKVILDMVLVTQNFQRDGRKDK